MPPEQIIMLKELLETRFTGLEKLIEEKFEQNEQDHKAVRDHLAKLNGQTAKNTEFRIKQGTHNKWMYGLVISVAVPTLFLILKNYIDYAKFH